MVTIRNMTPADIPAGMQLKGRAGWNQLEADWRRLLALQPDGGFLAELDGDPVGTVTTCRFGPVAWVAMMLVDERHRGRGIGRALMTRALDELAGHGVGSIRLDATPLGRPLYESLGFRQESTVVRHQGGFYDAGGPPPLSGPGGSRVELDGVCALDRAVTDTERGRLIRALAEEHPDSLRIVGDPANPSGYLLSRPGSRARQIGPCIADDDTGPRLLTDASRRYAGEPVFIDVPTANAAGTALVGSLGLRAARELTRMGRGPRVNEDLSRLWASAGPEKG